METVEVNNDGSSTVLKSQEASSPSSSPAAEEATGAAVEYTTHRQEEDEEQEQSEHCHDGNEDDDDDDGTKKMRMKKKASESYLESSPLLKLTTSRKLNIKMIDGLGGAAVAVTVASSSSSSSKEGGDSGETTSHTADVSVTTSSTNTTTTTNNNNNNNARTDDDTLQDEGTDSASVSASASASASGGGGGGTVAGNAQPPATYKTHVFEVMQQMEKSHELILKQQDEKSLAFRRRIDELISSIEVTDGDHDDDDDDGIDDDDDDDEDVDVDFGDNHDDDYCCGDKMTAKNKIGSTSTITGDGGTVATAASTYMYETSLATNKSHDSMDNIDCDSCEYQDHTYDQYVDHQYAAGHHHHHQHHHQHQPNRSPSSHHVVIGNLPLLDEEKPLEKTVDDAGHFTTRRQLASPSSYRRSSPSSLSSTSYTSIFVLRKEVDRMKSELDNVKTENSALHAIKLSYQNRTIQEINHSRSLEQQVCMLERKVQELLIKNTEQEKISNQFEKQCRVERMKSLSQEATLQHKNERVRRDVDKLWKKYKTSKHQLSESQQLVQDLQDQVRQYEQKERKWQKEKSFMKDKLDFQKAKNTKLSKMLKDVREHHSMEIADLNSKLHDLQQQL